MLNENQIDIVELYETWPDQTIKDVEIHINGYQISRNGRDKYGGGGSFSFKGKFD